MNHFILASLPLIMLSSCTPENQPFASGTLEATEVIISAEATGVIKSLNISEGSTLRKGQYIGYIDSTQIYLRKKQLEAQIRAIMSRSPNVAVQLAALQEQLIQAENEQKRISNLLKEDAATRKQMDDINAQVQILKRQIDAQKSNLGITNHGLNEETAALNVQIQQVSDQLQKCRIINPVAGTVLSKYAEENEMIMSGKSIYKVADLSYLIMRAYVSGEQLHEVKIGQQVKIKTGDKQAEKIYTGTIEWISDKAEFTPKTIQTKEERANLVYAMKVRVKNDGLLKIGMYADLNL